MPGAERLRVLRPGPNVLAFYEGRDGRRYAEQENWVDAGALSLGIASYAIVDGGEALVYDTHVSVERGRLIRSTLEREGVGAITVVLSHHHLDHVAGTEAFAGCEVIATARAAEHLRRNRDAIERGELEGPPAIDPLVLPTRTFEGRLELRIGSVEAELIAVDIHSDDAAVRVLQRCRDEPELRDAPLRELIADSLAAGSITWFEPYEAVHRLNVAAVLAAGGAPAE